MDNPKISVIVPVYNVEQYLPRCLDSILAQTFTDFELLLIDDGSKDNSGKICDEYAGIDSRIRVFHKENGGVSSARNVGLDNAIGEWICFVDSDDTLDVDFLHYSLLDIPSFVDIVFLSWAKKENGKIVYEKILPDVVYDSVNLHKVFSETDIVSMGVPWGRIYKMNVVLKYNLRFDINLPISEDRLFFYEYIIHSRGILLRSHIGYFFRITNQGLSSKKLSAELCKIRIDKLSKAVCKVKTKLNLSPREYFPFWFQQLIYVSSLINVRVKNVRNPIARIHLMRKVFYMKFDYKFYDEQGKDMRKYISRSCGIRLSLLLKRHFVLYNLYNSINQFANSNKILKRSYDIA